MHDRDTLRTGACLVRALLAGDETARGPLADLLLQHHEAFGLTYVRADYAATALRDSVFGNDFLTAKEKDGATSAWIYLRGSGGMLCLGYWPADIWGD